MKHILLFLIILWFLIPSVSAEEYYFWMKKCIEYNYRFIDFTISQNWKNYSYIKDINWIKYLYRDDKKIDNVKNIIKIHWYVDNWEKLMYSVRENWKNILYKDDNKLLEYIATAWPSWYFYDDKTNVYSLEIYKDDNIYLFKNWKLEKNNIEDKLNNRVYYSENKLFTWSIVKEWKWYYLNYNWYKSNKYHYITWLNISNDWKQYFYWFLKSKNDNWNYIMNWKEIKYDDFTKIYLSPDFKTFVYSYKKKDKYILVINWKEIWEYDSIMNYVNWYPNKKDFYVRVIKDWKRIWNINWKDFDEYEDLYIKVFSKNWDEAFIWNRDWRDYLIVNWKETYNYDNIVRPTYSENWEDFYSLVDNNNEHFVVFNWIEWKHYNRLEYFQYSKNLKIFYFYTWNNWHTLCNNIWNIHNLSEKTMKNIWKIIWKINSFSIAKKIKIRKIIKNKILSLKNDSLKSDVLNIVLNNVK